MKLFETEEVSAIAGEATCGLPETVISIIVPVYKVEPYLVQCVESILYQTYENLEILLIDDGSPDKCGEICDSFASKDCRIKVFHTENRGLSAARNLGLKEAKGEYIGFIDSDDWIEPDMFEVLLNYMKLSDAEIGVCGFFYNFQDSQTEYHISEKTYIGKEALSALIEGKINSGVWNKLYRKELFAGISFPEGKYFEDVAVMHVLMAKAKRIACISPCMYHYRQQKESITRTHYAVNLIDYSDAYFSRRYYLEDYYPDLYREKHEQILRFTAQGISRLWRWWFGVSKEDKTRYNYKIRELKAFSRENIPLFGYRSWPLYLRISTLFMRSDSSFSFAILYGLNQLYQRLRAKAV